MKRSKQLHLPFVSSARTTHFGGSTIKGNPRGPRVITTKRPMHLVLRSSHATGELSLLSGKRQKAIRLMLEKQAAFFNVRIYRFANAGNHLHLLVRVKNRREFGKFLRAVAGIIARITLQKQRGSGPQKIKFWDSRPYTRIVEWGRDYLGVRKYLQMNSLEAVGFLPLRKKLYVELCSTA